MLPTLIVAGWASISGCSRSSETRNSVFTPILTHLCLPPECADRYSLGLFWGEQKVGAVALGAVPDSISSGSCFGLSNQPPSERLHNAQGKYLEGHGDTSEYIVGRQELQICRCAAQPCVTL